MAVWLSWSSRRICQAHSIFRQSAQTLSSRSLSVDSPKRFSSIPQEEKKKTLKMTRVNASIRDSIPLGYSDHPPRQPLREVISGAKQRGRDLTGVDTAVTSVRVKASQHEVEDWKGSRLVGNRALEVDLAPAVPLLPQLTKEIRELKQALEASEAQTRVLKADHRAEQDRATEMEVLVVTSQIVSVALGKGNERASATRKRSGGSPLPRLAQVLGLSDVKALRKELDDLRYKRNHQCHPPVRDFLLETEVARLCTLLTPKVRSQCGEVSILVLENYTAICKAFSEFSS